MIFEGSTLCVVAGSLFTLLLVAAAVVDVRTRRIPNELVLVLAICGLVFSAASAPVVPGLLRGAAGLIVGLLVWLPFYAIRWLGAGDVKLFGAAAAWLGPMGALEATLLAAFAGGCLAVIWVARKGRLGRTFRSLGYWAMGAAHTRAVGEVPLAQAENAVPYGVALAVGLGVAAWYPGLLF